MATWNLDELRTLIKTKFPREKYEKANVLINSIDWKLRASRYHVCTAREVVESFFENGEFDTDIAMRLAFSESEESRKFSQAVSVRGFNLVAAAITMHSAPEIIAQLISLLFCEEEPDVHEVTLGSTIRSISNDQLKNSLTSIKISPEYEYLLGFTNTIKHISLVLPSYQVSIVGHGHNGVLFRTFTYKNKQYPEKTDIELLSDLDALSKKYIETGVHINAALP